MLIPVVFLIGLRFGGEHLEHLKETIMKKKLSVKARVTKFNAVVASIITHISETIWAIGTSVTAAMAISTLTH
jgi:hypothetical protein